MSVDDMPVDDVPMDDLPMDDLRRDPRIPSTAVVELSHPSLGRWELQAKNLSDGGVFALRGHHPPPPVGTVVQVRIKRHTGALNRDPVPMKVVHHQADGIGLMFLAAASGEAYG